jgi:hypothetical protein
MITKRLLRPDRQRQVPAGFSWVDHRLVRQDYFARADHAAWALYLFLVSVGDVHGLSYYSDPALRRHLRCDATQLAAARRQLVALDLLAHQPPLYQVLAWPDASVPAGAAPSGGGRTGQVQSVGDLLRRVLQGGAV